MNDLVEKARLYATSAHAAISHLRKYTLQPYDVHLKAVAEIVASVTEDAAMIAAAWLHDVVEDTPATLEDVEREFGADIMTLVREVTDISRPADGNRAVRKALDRAHFAAASPRGKTIKLADLIHNCEDICRHDARFGRIFLAEMRALMEVLGEGDRRVYDKAEKTMASCAEKLGAGAVATSGSPTAMVAAGMSLAGGQRAFRLFAGAFVARDIVEPLVSCDAESLLAGQCDRQAPVIGICTNSVLPARRNGR